MTTQSRRQSLRVADWTTHLVVGSLAAFLLLAESKNISAATGDIEASSAADVSEDDKYAPGAREHWAWRPIAKPDIPDNIDSDWDSDPVDAFVLRRLDEAGIRPAGPASRHALLRRVAFHLTGLPPTGAMIAKLADDSYVQLVDNLLGSPEFGEAWAQHWLDLVRFAETKGHEGDHPIPHAWRYRDYVIQAFTANVPYDAFVREHVSGDLLESPRLDPETKTNQSIQGTGFWHLGEATHSPVDIRGEEADRIDNQIDVFGKTFLGLTIACARCHDHKFDWISSEDYYAICGFIQSSSYQLANVADPIAMERVAAELTALNQSQGSHLVSEYVHLTRSRLESLRDHLLAAAQQARQMATESASHPTEPSQDEAESSDPIAALAKELITAATDLSHPLYPFAQAAMVLGADEPSSVETILDGIYRRWEDRAKQEKKRTAEMQVVATRKEGELNPVATSVPFNTESHVVVNFSAGLKSDGSGWLTSGYCFGERPGEVGEVVLVSSAERPLRRVIVEPGACSDRTSSNFTGLYRTPTFEVVGDRLWYRYRGKAEVFLDVDSHRTVLGPLHGVVKQKLDSPDEDAWFAHRVDDYLGHRVHVDFVPEGEFQLFEVRFGPDEPASPWHPNSRLVAQLRSDDPSTLRQLAETMTRLFESALPLLEEQLVDREAAELANWLLAHDDTLPAAEADLTDSYRKLAADFVSERKRLESSIPEAQWALALLDGSGEDERIHGRGNHRELADQPTRRRFLKALDGELEIPRGSGRLQMAERMVDPGNPLMARVFVNRVWQHLFGEGIVSSVDNFGKLGELPTHPELLDYLATNFVDDGWDIKQLIRRLVLTKTYRMSTTPDPVARELDPENRLLHAARIRRLTGEQIRDAILAVSGKLDRTRYGPSVRIHITDFMRDNRSPSWSGPMDGDRRRSIYVEVRRNAPSHFLAAFDKPTPFTTVGHRYESNSAAQPLILLNDALVHQQAGQWASHLVEQFATDDDAIEDAYQQAFSRPPTLREQERIREHLAVVSAEPGDRDQRIQAWTEICLTLYNVKEFIFLL